MSKVALLLVVATAATVAVQGFPNHPNDIPTAIHQKDWDQLHRLLLELHRREFGNGLSPVQTFVAPQQLRPAVQTFAAPQQVQPIVQAFAASQPGPGRHSIGSGVTSFVSSRTGPDGVTRVQHGGDGFFNRDGQVTRYNLA